MMIDSPAHNDNREYDYSQFIDGERAEYEIIVDMVANNSTVIDLGCGNGSLLARLQEQKQVKGMGIEISESGVAACRTRGLNVSTGRIDVPLSIADNVYDYAICNVTIQMVMYPEVLLREMKRIARYQIISFPNFGFWRNRFDLLIHGRMPQPMLFGYQWYSTGHIHQLSFNDFHQLVNTVGGLTVREKHYTEPNGVVKKIFASAFPNLFHQIGIMLTEKN